MDELDLVIAFDMKRRPGWLYAKFDILKKELFFWKLNREYVAAPPECQLEMVNNLVRTLEQENVHYFDLFASLANEKHRDTSGPLQQATLDDAL